jgi:hypothetical protein
LRGYGLAGTGTAGPKTGFIGEFTNDQEPGAQLSDLATSLCAVLVAQA